MLSLKIGNVILNTYRLYIVLLFSHAVLSAMIFQDEKKSTYVQENDTDLYLAPELDINDFLRGGIENFRDQMVFGVPKLGIPILDIYRSNNTIKFNFENDNIEIDGTVDKLCIIGLSKFVLVEFFLDLENLTLMFDLYVPDINATGIFALEGEVMGLIPFSGSDDFWMAFTNLSLSSSASVFRKTSTMLQVAEDFDVDIDFDDVMLDVGNFLADSDVGEFFSSGISTLSMGIFKTFQPTIKEKLKSNLFKMLNHQLSQFKINFGGFTANEFIDQLIINLRRVIASNEHDPMDLPDKVVSFKKQGFILKQLGNMKLYDGKLYGMSSIYRAGDSKFESNKTTLVASAFFGLTNLSLEYAGEMKVMFIKSTVGCTGFVKYISVYIEIEQSNSFNSKPVIRDIKIVDMSKIVATMTGLKIVTKVLKDATAVLSDHFKPVIMEIATNNIRKCTQKALDDL